MKTIDNRRIRSFILATVLGIGLGVATPASADSYLVDLNSKKVTALGTLGGNDTVAIGINAAGQVVGYDDTTTGVQHAFVTGPNGVGMTDLNSLVVGLPAGVVLSEATAINNSGQVVAMSPVPEPQTYALMLAGLILTGVMVRRKQQG